MNLLDLDVPIPAVFVSDKPIRLPSYKKWHFQTASASCLAVTESHIMIGCADGVVRIFSSKTLHYITSLPRPHFLGVDVAAGHDQR